MKRRALFIAAMLAVAWVAFHAGEVIARPKSSGGCSSCGVPSGGSYVSSGAASTIVSTANGVYRQTCVNGQCTRVKVEASELTWLTNPDDPDSVSLMLGGQQIGALRISTGKYYPMGDDKIFAAEPCDPPIAPPAGQTVGAVEEAPVKAADGRPLFFGVESNKIGPEKCYSINGKKCSKEAAFEAVGAGDDAGLIPDDCEKLSVTVVGTKEMRDKARAAMAGDPELAALRQYIVEQYYAPDDPMVKDLGFPVLTVQDAGGVVLSSADTATPETLKEAVKTGVRKRRPDLDPSTFPKVGDGFSLAGLWKLLSGGQSNDNIGGVLAVILIAFGLLKGK